MSFVMGSFCFFLQLSLSRHLATGILMISRQESQKRTISFAFSLISANISSFIFLLFAFLLISANIFFFYFLARSVFVAPRAAEKPGGLAGGGARQNQNVSQFLFCF